ncbi:MAG: hypothetical protein AAB320_00840 [Elusimicrobiota bacterium]
MRYWVYKDAQILGPWAREDLAQEGGLRGDTLVSAEGGSMDWRCAEEVSELSGLYVSYLPPSPQGPSVDYEYGALERLQFETLGLESESSEWLAGIFDASGPKIQGAGLSLQAADLLVAQNRVRELTDQLELLTKRVAELEGAQPNEWPAIGKGTPFLPPDKPQLRALGPAQRAPGSAEPPAYPAGAPELPALPAIPEPKAAPGSPEPETESPGTEPARSESATRPGWLPAVSPPKKPLKFGATKSFRRAGDPESPSAPPPAAAQAPPAPDFSLPAAPVLAPPPVPVSAPAPAFQWDVPAPAPAGLPPAPAFSQPAPTLSPPPPTEPPSMPPLTAPPMPSFGGGAVPTPAGLPPMTMSFSTGGAAASAPAGVSPFGPLTPSPDAGEASQPGPATKEVLARLAKPQAAPVTAAPAPRRSQKKFFIIVGLLVTGLIVAGGLFFFRNSKDIKTAVDMEGGEAPMGAQPMEESPIPKRPESEPATQPAPQAQAPAPPPEAAPQDERPAAVELVRGYPLYGERGTIGQWLQFSFTADPANGNVEKWDAGAVEASTFLVQYTVQPGGKAIGEAITYLFEADLARRTVRGKNPAAVELMAGGPAPKKTAPRKKPARKRRAEAPAAVVPKQLPQLPLPSDSELAPPSEDDADFRSDTVEPNL